MASQPIKEEYLLSGPLEPTNEWYALAKIAGIKMCQAYRRQYGFNAVSVMPTNLYGPNDNFDLETSHVLPALYQEIPPGKAGHEWRFRGILKDEERFGKISEPFRTESYLYRADAGFAGEEKKRLLFRSENHPLFLLGFTHHLY